MFQLFSNRFHYRLDFEQLCKVWHHEWHNWIHLLLVVHVHTHVTVTTFIVSQWDLYSVIKIPNIKNFYDLVFMRYISSDL